MGTAVIQPFEAPSHGVRGLPCPFSAGAESRAILLRQSSGGQGKQVKLIRDARLESASRVRDARLESASRVRDADIRQGFAGAENKSKQAKLIQDEVLNQLLRSKQAFIS